MSNGYDQFFKQARKAAATQAPTRPVKRRDGTRLDLKIRDEEVEDQIRRRMKMSKPVKNKKPETPWKMIVFSLLGFVLAGAGFHYYEEVENFIKRIEVSAYGEAYAQDNKAPAAKTPAAVLPETTAAPSSAAPITSAEIDHLKNLNDRKKQLDAREEELARIESELGTQRVELDKKLKELQEMRDKISATLEDRVKLDSEKIETLVQVYTNMRPPQAAKVFETMDEDLAVEILGRMKKKSAADIMNLLQPEKAQTLSEMYAGFKRSPASIGDKK